jgi:hypothetical protein
MKSTGFFRGRFSKISIACACAVLSLLSARAQSSSINAVAYVDANFVAGSNLVANPLNAGNNTISNLFRGVPDGSVFLPWDKNAGTFAVSNSYHAESGWTDPAATLVMPQGGFLWLPSPAKITFVGDIAWPIGCYSYPRGDSVSTMPLAACRTCDFGPCAGGDWASDQTTIWRWNASQQAWGPPITYFYDFQCPCGVWFPSTPTPTAPAEAARFYMPSAFSALMSYPGGNTSVPSVTLRDWQRSATNGTFRFAAENFIGYSLLSSTNLESNSWSIVQQGLADPTNGYVTLNVAIPADGAVFYRIGSFSQARPQLFNPSRSGTQFQFQFHAASGISYTAQKKTLLTDSLWQYVTTVNGNGGVVTVSDNTAAASSGYYRLQF